MNPWELDDLRHDVRRFLVEHPLSADERRATYQCLRAIERTAYDANNPAQEPTP